MRMYKTARRLLFAALGILVACAPGPAQTLHLPPHEKIVLKNGLTVLLMEKHGVPIINIAAIVKTGAAADPAGQDGLASTTAALLRKGTKSRSAQQYAKDLDYIGASFDAEASADFTQISAEFLTKDTAKGLELVADAILHPTFPQEETEKLLSQSLDGVRAAKDEAGNVLGIYYYGYLFGGHPYGRPSSGDEISLKRIHRSEVEKFYETYYAPGNTILAVAGEFKAAEMRKSLEDIFGAWPAKEVPKVNIPVAQAAKGKRLLLIDKPDSTQTYFAIGNVGTAVGDPDRVTIRVVNTVFGGRFTSMLNEALRVESGLTYGAESFFDSRKTPGAFGMFSYTKNETTVQAIDLALQTMAKLRKDGLTEEQLNSAKTFIKGQFPPSLETSGELVERIASNEFYGLNDDEVNQLEARLAAVTPEMARQAIQKHFPESQLVFVLIGKASEIGPAVQKYAEKQDARAIKDAGFWPPPGK